MAADDKPARKPRIRKVETIRERAEKAQIKDEKPKRRRLRAVTGKAAAPFRAAHRLGRKEYYPIKPREDNRIGRVMTTRRSWIPRYFREAWAELKLVIWPTGKETWKMTMAVFVFATLFGLIVTLTDWVLEKGFKELLLR